MINRNQTYRIIAAYFMVVLIAQVFVMQGFHHVIGHHDHGEACNVKGVHVHSEGHGHFSCDLCLFQFTPSEIVESGFEISLPEPIFIEKLSNYYSFHKSLKLLQTQLRGPPHFIV